MCVAALGLSVFRISDHREFPVFGSITEMRVHPGGTASSAPVKFCWPTLGCEPGASPPGTNFTKFPFVSRSTISAFCPFREFRIRRIQQFRRCGLVVNVRRICGEHFRRQRRSFFLCPCQDRTEQHKKRNRQQNSRGFFHEDTPLTASKFFTEQPNLNLWKAYSLLPPTVTGPKMRRSADGGAVAVPVLWGSLLCRSQRIRIMNYC